MQVLTDRNIDNFQILKMSMRNVLLNHSEEAELKWILLKIIPPPNYTIFNLATLFLTE
jgi:hypothetical protein